MFGFGVGEVETLGILRHLPCEVKELSLAEHPRKVWLVKPHDTYFPACVVELRAGERYFFSERFCFFKLQKFSSYERFVACGKRSDIFWCNRFAVARGKVVKQVTHERDPKLF